jgi:transcriptional regulator of nitric oxide reductase
MSLRPALLVREAFSLALSALVALAVATPAVAEKGKLRERLTPEVMAVVFPGAERLGPEEGTPPAIAAYKDGKVAAYIFSTLDIVAGLVIRPRPSTSSPGSM